MQILHDWEHISRSAVLSSISGEAIRQVNRVQLLLDIQLFHIDIDSDDFRKLPRLRQIVDDPTELIAVLKMYADRNIRVSLQSSGDSEGAYTISLLRKISQAVDSNGLIQYAFTDKDDLVHVDSFSRFGEVSEESRVVLWTTSINST